MPDEATVSYLTGQTPIASELRSAEWDLVPVELKERSFFMSTVEDVEILEAFQEEAAKIVSGESSESEARLRLREFLDERGYEPLPGQEGTIKDLRTPGRMNIVLRTNRDMARGYGLWKRQQEVLATFPAWKYVRARTAEEPRDWPTAWNEARAATTEYGATLAQDEDTMFALVNHPLFLDPGFNDFETPYPPYKFGSGMSVSGVSFNRAVSLGLLPTREEDPEGYRITQDMLRPRDRGFNEDLSVAPAVRSQALRDELASRLQGFAEWEGDRLKFTDPNGTTPGTPDEIADVITRPLPVDPERGENFPQLQAEALELFALDPEEFASDARRNRWEDFGRLIARILGTEARDRFLLDLWLDAQAARESGGVPDWLFQVADTISGVLAEPDWIQAEPLRGKARAVRRLRALAKFITGGYAG